MNPLDQLLRDAMTEHTEAVPHLRPGAARRALLTSRRRRTASMAAAGTATLAATAGVGAFVVSQQPSGSVSGQLGGPGGSRAATAKEPAGVKSAPARSFTQGGANVAPKVSALSTPVASEPPAGDFSAKGEPESAAPAELRSISLTGPVAGLTVTPQPSGVHGGDPYYQLSDSGKWSKWYWFAPTGRSDDLGSAGAVIITEGVSRPYWNQRQSPSPTVSATTVNQRPGTVWLSGGDREIYFTAGAFTVEVFVGDGSVSVEQMEAVGNAVQGLPQ